MKIRLILLFLVVLSTTVSAQNQQRQTAPSVAALAAERARMEEQYEELRTSYNDLIAVVEDQRRQINTLRTEIDTLKKSGTDRATSNSASFATKEELANLQKAISEMNEKWNRQREEDQKLIVARLEELKKLATQKPPAIPQPQPSVTTKGIDHPIAQGDTYSGIVKAYNDQLGLGITVEDLKRANPGVDPTKLMVGKTVFVPDPR